MNSNLFFANLTRFVALLLMQVLVFKRITFANINIYIYPVFIMLLPAETPTALVVLVSFAFGLSLDMFYDSPGIHAGACVFTAYLRYFILGFLEPKGGYPLNSGPTQAKLGVTWFIRYAAIFLFLHLFIYYSIEAFSLVFIVDILIRTVLSFIFSMIFVIMYQFLLDPKE